MCSENAAVNLGIGHSLVDEPVIPRRIKPCRQFDGDLEQMTDASAHLSGGAQAADFIVDLVIAI